MPSPRPARIRDHFAGLADPRRRKVVYPLIGIVAIAVRAVICGADDFVAIADWAREKRGWLAASLDLGEDAPSHDRFNAVLAAPAPGEFEKCLLSWVAALHEVTAGQVVAIDGEALRRSYDPASGKSAIRMVSAWATADHISLGQVAVDAKSDEITAIPELLELLEVTGGLVTIDAMGCQTAIASATAARGADYAPAVKENQPTPYAGIEAHFLGHMEDDFARVKVGRHETTEHAHGRDEHRTYCVCDAPADLPDRGRWGGLERIGVAISEAVRSGKATDAVRYDILSERMGARSFAGAVRGHWSIENRLHRQLDVTFGEDRCRVRKGHADADSSAPRRTALSLLKDATTRRVGMKNKRLRAGWNASYPEQVLFGS